MTRNPVASTRAARMELAGIIVMLVQMHAALAGHGVPTATNVLGLIILAAHLAMFLYFVSIVRSEMAEEKRTSVISQACPGQPTKVLLSRAGGVPCPGLS